MKLDYLLPQLDALSEAEADAIFAAAKTDRTFRLQLVGLFVGWLVAIALVSLAIPAFYRAYHPVILIKLCLAALMLIGIWQSVKLARRYIEHFYCGAIMRQVHAQSVSGP